MNNDTLIIPDGIKVILNEVYDYKDKMNIKHV